MKIPLMLGAALLTACSSATRPTTQPSAPMSAPAVTTNAAAIEKARADSARLPYTEADVHFMTMMIGHHGQAVKVAGWAATHGASAAVQRLADRIINGQQDEITLMQQWLIDRRKPAPTPEDLVQHHHMMPGMLTQAQLQQLDAARGTEFDRLFLTFMIQHHGGAVTMARALFATTGAAQDQTVYKFASDVNVDQTTEIARMEQMLASLTTR